MEREKVCSREVSAPSASGGDLDFREFREEAPEHAYLPELTSLPPGEQEDLLKVGIEVAGKERAGTFLQKDHSVIHTSVLHEGLEVMSTTEALARYPWLEEYYWRAVAVDADAYTRRAAEHQEHGYFIRALPGARIIYPVQACLYISAEGLAQDVHNIVIAEEGSELHIITGCATGAHVRSGLHVGVTEFYVKEGAKVSFTMIHSWAEKVAVRPRTGVVVAAGGVYLSNYVCMRPVRSLQMYPTAYLEGRESLARFHSILVAPPGSHLDVGSRVVLRGEGSRAEIIARSLTTGGCIINRGHLRGETPGVRGHLECRGLMLAPEGAISAVPEIEARAGGVELSHEAAVGKIAEEEIEYLMARGLSEEEATAAIVRGFLNVKIMGLPPQLEEEIQRAISLSQEAGF